MNRREALQVALAAGGLAACGRSGEGAQSAKGDPLRGEGLMRDVAAYVGFGIHRSGGAGDEASAEWMAKRFAALGYVVEQPAFDIANTDTTIAQLETSGETFTGFAQPPIAFTPAGGLSAPLANWNPMRPGDTTDKIAVIRLPRADGAPSPSAAYRETFGKARDARAAAVLGVISSPSGELTAINTPVDLTFEIPALLIGEKDKKRLDTAMAKPGLAKLRIEGPGGMRPARNTIARYGKKGPWLIVSTPRSGWFTCGGERGPGIAMSLAFADLAVRNIPCRLCFIAASGHEWLYRGADIFRKTGAPKPDETAMWLHLGASFAARGYQESPEGLKPLESASPSRTLMVSDDLSGPARIAFAGQAGLETPDPAIVEKSAGELTGIIAEGYRSIAGFFGANPLFHTPIDGADATTPAILEQVARSTWQLVEARLKRL